MTWINAAIVPAWGACAVALAWIAIKPKRRKAVNEDISEQIAQVEAMDQARDLESGTRRLEAEGAEVARLNGKLGEALGNLHEARAEVTRLSESRRAWAEEADRLEKTRPRLPEHWDKMLHDALTKHADKQVIDGEVYVEAAKARVGVRELIESWIGQPDIFTDPDGGDPDDR